MSMRPLNVLVGDVSRREMLGALARWSVPTVLTMTLITRQAQAAASCPPCTQKTGGRCRSCTMNQILNCQCEPCLGAPYCANGASAAVSSQQGMMAAPTSGLLGGGGGTAPLSTPLPLTPDLMNPYYRTLRSQPAFSGGNPFDVRRSAAGTVSPFGAYGVPADTAARARGGLFDRLRGDSRRPF